MENTIDYSSTRRRRVRPVAISATVVDEVESAPSMTEVDRPAGALSDVSRGDREALGVVYDLTASRDRVRASQASRDRDLRVGIREFAAEQPGVDTGVETTMEDSE